MVDGLASQGLHVEFPCSEWVFLDVFFGPGIAAGGEGRWTVLVGGPPESRVVRPGAVSWENLGEGQDHESCDCKAGPSCTGKGHGDRKAQSSHGHVEIALTKIALSDRDQDGWRKAERGPEQAGPNRGLLSARAKKDEEAD